jgi:glycosyltransferase involved in cell wall biosynthesis
MSIKVCFLGAARYIRPLDETAEKKFRAISSLGEAFIVGFSSDLRPRRFTEHAYFYLLPQLPFAILRYVALFVFGQFLVLWFILRHRIQIVVAQSPYEGFVAALSIKFAAWFGYKVGLAVEVHGDFEESLFLYRRIRFRALHRFLMKQAALYSLAQADVLRAISSSTTNQLKRWVPETTIVQFPAWTDIETFFAAGRTKANKTSSIVYAGVLSPVKGIHHLINAFSVLAEQFPSAPLFIIGKDENKSYAAGLRIQAKKLGLENRVRFTGPRPQSELAFWMSEAAVLVLPSTSEGLGRVIIEAMAAATPVIGSDVGGIPELIKDGVNGFLIAPGDEQALAEKLRWVLNNPDKARAMGERGRAFAAGSFSADRYVDGYRQIFALAQVSGELKEHATSAL